MLPIPSKRYLCLLMLIFIGSIMGFLIGRNTAGIKQLPSLPVVKLKDGSDDTTRRTDERPVVDHLSALKQKLDAEVDTKHNGADHWDHKQKASFQDVRHSAGHRLEIQPVNTEKPIIRHEESPSRGVPEQNDLRDFDHKKAQSARGSINDQFHNSLVYDQGYEAHWVHVNGSFHQRVAAYNVALAHLRKRILELRKESDWLEIEEPLEVLWCNGDDCLQVMSRYPHIQTVALAWQGYNRLNEWSSLNDTANMPLQSFFTWTVSEPLCSYIQSPGQTKARWDAVYNRECSTEVNKTNVPISLEPVYFHGKPINPRDYWPNDGNSYPPYFYTTPPPDVFHLHLLQDGIITKLGDVISASLKLLLYSCSQDIDPHPPKDYKTSPIHDEIFVVTQYWGDQFFHKMVEGYPRISPYLDFLRMYPNIKVHVAEVGGYTAAFMGMMGINSSRLVTNTCRAKVIYLPQSTPCGFTHAQSAQLLSNQLGSIQTLRQSSNVQDTIVMIQRISHERRFVQRDDIARILAGLAEEFSLQLVIFRDDPTPGMNDTMLIFRKARLVVAPHGAGLSNLLYAQPGTYVIEGVCNRPHVNMCFQWLAHVLGHHYHAIMAERGCLSVIDINVAEMERVARAYLQSAQKRMST